jgi:ABC-type branched-subunit amino acid transport system ATPase component
VLIKKESINGKRADEITLLGVGRTFQQPSLITDMTVSENMQVATHHRLSANIFSTLLGLPSFHRARMNGASEALNVLKAVGLGEMADELVSKLPYGYQRLVEIARALGVNPYLLIVDEPAAGLTLEEMKHLWNMLNEIKAQGVAILLIEHNMEFVMSIADRITVLDFGAKIAEGTPLEIQNDRRVLSAYLGEDDKNAL